jgi:uncharacterized alkaline shock family protein YloU
VPVDQLPCGAVLDDLLDQVVARTTPRDPQHQHSCPHCGATLAELEALWAPVHDLVAEDVTAPVGLLDAVMDRVRRLPRNAWCAIISTSRGDTRIASRVIGAIARLAAEEVSHVSLALGGGQTGAGRSLTGVAGAAGEPASEVGVAGTHVVVAVQVMVQMGARIPVLAEQVRAHIVRRLAEQTGLTAVEVNITVADVTERAPGRL